MFLSCATKYYLDRDNTDYPSFEQLIAGTKNTKLFLNTQLDSKITQTDGHVFIASKNYRTAAKVFSITLNEPGQYLVSVQSFMNFFYDDTIMIPKLWVYNNEIKELEVKELSRRALPPGFIDPVSQKSTYGFYVDKPNLYYLLVEADMTATLGIQLDVMNGGYKVKQVDILRVPYSKFEIECKKK